MKHHIKVGIIALSSLLALGACVTKTNVSTTKEEVKTAGEAQPIDNGTNGGMINPPVISGNLGGTSDYGASSNNGQGAAVWETGANKPILSIAEIGDRVYFATDSFTLSPEARALLAKQAHFLLSRPTIKIMVAGNCDERGTREYNLALGARRAASVKDYLISLGVKASQISTVSYGKERPIDDRPNAEGWAINRNAQTKVQ